MEPDDSDHDDTQTINSRPKTRGLKRALEQEKHEAEKLSFEERIAKEVEDDREVWLDRVNLHLENILHKANKDNEMLRNISNRYIIRNKICNIKIKNMKEKHKKTLIKHKEEDKLEIIFDASLVV